MDSHTFFFFYQSVYEDHRLRLKQYFKDGQTPVLWQFTPKLVFTRYDLFLHRLELLTVCVSNP